MKNIKLYPEDDGSYKLKIKYEKPSTHTPTPWNQTSKKNGSLTRQIKAGSSQYIGLTYKIENAAFIVRAVNAHEELLNNLKGIHAELEAAKIDWEANQFLAIARREAYKTIAKAEGK